MIPGRVLRALEIALLMIGVATLTMYGLLEFGQMRGQADLRKQFENDASSRVKTSEGTLPAELPGEGDASPGSEALRTDEIGEALGRLTSERLGLDVMIAEGVGYRTLSRAAGRIPGTARLDDDGNVGIAAHRDTFFRSLRDIQKGDVLKIETHKGRYRYLVEWMAVVEPSNVQFLESSSGSELTLVTCYPFYYVGPAPKRFIVRAVRVDEDSTEVAVLTP